MAVAITADEQTAYPPRVLVSVTGLTLGDSIELYRVVAGVRTLVRAGAAEDVTDTAFLRTDAELPFGVAVSYLALVNGADEYTTSPVTYTLPGGKVALTDAISGAAAEVTIVAWPDRSYGRDSTTYRVGGRNVVVTGPVGQAESSLEVKTEDAAGRESLLALIKVATEGTIQVRQPGGYDEFDAYLAVTGAAPRRVSPRSGTDPRRIWSLQVAEVEGWAPALEARGETLQDIADAYDGLTLDDLSDDYATLLAIAQAEF